MSPAIRRCGARLSGAGRSTQAGRASTRPLKLSGCVTAARRAMAAPIEMPPITGDGPSSVRLSAIMSAVNCAIERLAMSPNSESPCPRQSGQMPRQPATCGSSSVVWPESPHSPWMNRKGRPAPLAVTDRCRSPMDRRVRVITLIPRSAGPGSWRPRGLPPQTCHARSAGRRTRHPTGREADVASR